MTTYTPLDCLTLLHAVGLNSVFCKYSNSNTMQAFNRKLRRIAAKANGTSRITISTIGLCKAGKSTLLNTFIGAEVLPTAINPETAIPSIVQHSPNRNRVTIRHCYQTETDEEEEIDVFQGSVQEAKKHLTDLNRNARSLAAEHNSTEELRRRQREEKIPDYTVVSVYLTGLVAAGCSKENLDQIQIVDCPGSGERLNPVKLAIEDMAKISDILLVVADYTAMGQVAERDMWDTLGQLRSDLLHFLESRCLFYLNRADSPGMGAMGRYEACEYAAGKATYCIGTRVDPSLFRCGSARNGFGARIMLAHLQCGFPVSDDHLVEFAGPAALGFESLVLAFEGQIEELRRRVMQVKAERWTEILHDWQIIPLEKELAVKVERAGEIKAEIAIQETTHLMTQVLERLKLDITSLNETSEDLAGQEQRLKKAWRAMERYVKEELRPWVVRMKNKAHSDTESLRLDALNSIETVSRTLQESAAVQKVHHPTKAVADQKVRAIIKETEAKLRKSIDFTAGLPTHCLAILQCFRSHFISRIVPDYRAALRDAQSQLDGPGIDAQMPVELAFAEEVEQMKANLRKVHVFDEAFLRDAVNAYVKANHFTKTETKLVTETVIVGYAKRSCGGSDPIYGEKVVTKERQVKCTDYPVCESAVVAYVVNIFLISVKRTSLNFQQLAENSVTDVEKVLIAALEEPLADAKHRVKTATKTVKGKAGALDADKAELCKLRDRLEEALANM